MTDTSKCGGFNCPFKDECLRFTGTASGKQSYVGPAYKEGACNNFLPNSEYRVPLYHKFLMWKWLWPVAWVAFMSLIALMSI